MVITELTPQDFSTALTLAEDTAPLGSHCGSSAYNARSLRAGAETPDEGTR